MVDDDRTDRALGGLLPGRLAQLQRASGLPVVFAGATRRVGSTRTLTLTTFRGTLGCGLDGLTVDQGRGLGGTVVVRGRPCRVDDYAATSTITHDFDRVVVGEERLNSVIAFPVMVRGTVRGVLYGATRDRVPIGDVALRNAATVAAQLSHDLESPLTPHAGSGSTGSPESLAATAMTDLARLAASAGDPELRQQLARIHQVLSRAPTAGAPTNLLLSPRELDVLRLVAVGHSNRDIAPQLGLSIETVKAYLRSTMRKLEVGNRTAAVHAARTAGILTT